MALIEEQIVSMLKADSAVNAIISGRIHAIVTPDNPLFPCITYERTSSLPIDDNFQTASNLKNSTFYLNLWNVKKNNSYLTIKDLARKCSLVLNGFRGVVLSTQIESIVISNEIDSWEQELECYRVIQQYKIIHRES